MVIFMRSKTKSKAKHFEVVPLVNKYKNARYFYILGERGCGKTFPVIRKCIDDYFDGKGVFAYIRRYKESLSAKNMADIVSVHDEYVAKRTNGQWNKIKYWQGRFYLEQWGYNSNNELVRMAKNPVPIGGAWSMNTWETDKGPDFGADKGGISNIVFDEVLSKAGHYLSDEWSIFQNVISSLVRDRWQKDTKIWLLANPISKFANPYFRNMGITKKLIAEPGTTLIEYPDENGKPQKNGMSTLFVYIAAKTDKDGNVIEVDENRTNLYKTFFAFTNSKGKSNSIVHGLWEMEDSPRLPSGVYENSDKKRTVYLTFDEELLAIDIMKYEITNKYYLFIYPTKRIREKTYYITLGYSLDKYAIIGNISNHPILNLINSIYETGQVYYSDDATADAFHGFRIEARKRQI